VNEALTNHSGEGDDPGLQFLVSAEPGGEGLRVRLVLHEDADAVEGLASHLHGRLRNKEMVAVGKSQGQSLGAGMIFICPNLHGEARSGHGLGRGRLRGAFLLGSRRRLRLS